MTLYVLFLASFALVFGGACIWALVTGLDEHEERITSETDAAIAASREAGR